MGLIFFEYKMAKVDFKKAKKITKAGAPVEHTLKWSVMVTEQNILDLIELTKNSALKVDEQVELEGEVFIKRLSFKAGRDVAKAYEWDINYDDIEKSELKSVDSDRLQASQLIGCVCVDAKGSPFFESVQDVYDSDPAFIAALYKLADDINNFMGKSRTKNSTSVNSSASLSSTESVDEPLKKHPKK